MGVSGFVAGAIEAMAVRLLIEAYRLVKSAPRRLAIHGPAAARVIITRIVATSSS